MSYSRPLIAALSTVALMTGCQTSGSATAGSSSGASTARGESNEAETDPQPRAERPEPTLRREVPDGYDPVTTLRWLDASRLAVGYRDGRIAEVDVGEQSGHVRTASSSDGRVIAVYPDLKLALLADDPGTLVRTSDGKTVLQLDEVDDITSATFTPDGKGFFVAEPSGDLHIWKGADKLQNLPGSSVQQFLNRQLADFVAHFSSIRGPLYTTKQKQIALGDKTGGVLWWDPSTPNEVQFVARNPAPIQSITAPGRHVAAVSTDGSLRVADRETESFVRWSMEARAQYVSTAPGWTDRFAQVGGGKLGLRRVADGSFEWTLALPDGDRCGLEVAPGGQHIAVCIDGELQIYGTQPPTLVAAVGRRGNSLVWADVGE
ncbi:MAG: WD40 repeat domain-containing protein [Bradymonadaceae bacterium]